MIDNSLNYIEKVLHAVELYQKKSLQGDFEKRGLETRWPDIQGALKAIDDIRFRIKTIKNNL